MRKKRSFNLAHAVLATSFIVLVFVFVMQVNTMIAFNKEPVTVADTTKDSSVFIVNSGVDASTDTWETTLADGDDPDDTTDYIGATISIQVANKQKFNIDNWTLRIGINNHCYLNGFWCGDFEVHQFRGDEEIVETINTDTYLPSETKLEHNLFFDDMMITLEPGDYLIYHPSEAQSETVVPANGEVGIGAIFYFEDTLDTSDMSLTYYNEMQLADGPYLILIIVLFTIWVIAFVMYMTSKVTYVRTKHTVESLSHAIISGLSQEYKTLWLIHVNEKTIELIRNLDEKNVNVAIHLARKFEDYDESINYYIDHYVDAADRENVRREVTLESLEEHLREQKSYTISYLHHSPDGSKNYFQMAFTKIGNEKEGNDIVLAYRDVDEIVKEEQKRQKQLEDALKQAESANRAKSQFLANMSHEIRTPINAILGMDTMILREVKDEEVKEYARDIKAASNTLLALINDILDFSKIESGKMEIIPGNYMLDSVVNDLNNMIRGKAEDKNLGFEIKLNPETPVKLIGDEVRVKQIILNILNNAVKYTKEGEITWTIDFEKPEENVCNLKISVKDTGIGIKPEDLKNIYSPYTRFDPNQTKSIEGTGLGLSITKNLLEKMGSQLVVESVYGEGSDFSFVLRQETWGPETIGNNLTVTKEEEEKNESFHAPDAKILVVDDVDMNLIVIKNLLKRIKVEPEMVLSGAEAVKLCITKKYDIIFLDAMMPGMSGEETLAAIRQDADINADTPIIVLTANAVIGAKEEYLAAGFTDYLSKPVSGEDLEASIEKYLPKEKMVPVTEEDLAAEAEKVPNPYIEEISQIPEIQVEEGIKAAGGEDTYVNVCSNFYETADSRMQMIANYYAAMDLDNYSIQVHALKSSARLIGATKLSEQALALELASKDKNAQFVKENTVQLLNDYDKIQGRLKETFSKLNKAAEDSSDKEEITEKKLKRNLGDLLELVQSYDYETSKELLGSFEEYKLPEKFSGVYGKLKALLAEVNFDEMAKAITSYLEDEE